MIQVTPDDDGAKLGKTWWRTSAALFAQLDARFAFVLDACAAPVNALCDRFWTEADDALRQDWRAGGYVWCNWPFGRKTNPLFADKIAREARREAQIVALGPAAPNSSYWHTLAGSAHEIWCFSSRLCYGHPATGEIQHGNAFHSALFVFHGTPAPTWGPFLGSLSVEGVPATDAGRAVWRYVHRPSAHKVALTTRRTSALQLEVNRDGPTSKAPKRRKRSKKKRATWGHRLRAELRALGLLTTDDSQNDRTLTVFGDGWSAELSRTRDWISSDPGGPSGPMTTQRGFMDVCFRPRGWHGQGETIKGGRGGVNGRAARLIAEWHADWRASEPEGWRATR